jgi:hypothetical protein
MPEWQLPIRNGRTHFISLSSPLHQLINDHHDDDKNGNTHDMSGGGGTLIVFGGRNHFNKFHPYHAWYTTMLPSPIPRAAHYHQTYTRDHGCVEAQPLPPLHDYHDDNATQPPASREEEVVILKWKQLDREGEPPVAGNQKGIVTISV